MLVIEDDYDGELRFDVAPLPMLASLAPDVVAHLGTTSKILTPTLGAGWMVAPEAITSAVLAYRDLTGTRPSPAGQRVLYEFARNGDLGRHLRKLRREMAERRTLLAGALASAGVPVRGDDAGAHLVVPFSSAAVEASVIASAERRGIRLDGLARHFAGDAVGARGGDRVRGVRAGGLGGGVADAGLVAALRLALHRPSRRCVRRLNHASFRLWITAGSAAQSRRGSVLDHVGSRAAMHGPGSAFPHATPPRLREFRPPSREFRL